MGSEHVSFEAFDLFIGTVAVLLVPMLRYWIAQIQDLEKKVRKLEDVVKKNI